MKNGDVAIFESWTVDEINRAVEGPAMRYDMNRKLLASGTLRVAISDVALFESSKPVTSVALAPLLLVTGASLALTAVCIVEPKTCFGSCPTIYVPGEHGEYLAAEAFSDAVAPALARRDVDALFYARPRSRTFTLRVTNEALETHVINRADLLVAERPAGGRVLSTGGGTFLAVTDLTPPLVCAAPEGDCLSALRAADAHERWSQSGPHDLAEKEFIDLEFPDATSSEEVAYGLAIEARQTFVTTFLMYQALAYLGTRTGSLLASLSSGVNAEAKGIAGLFDLLGGIEVEVRSPQGDWQPIGRFAETGPIASDVQLIPLPAGVPVSAVRLRMTKGHFRIGSVARVRIAGPAVMTRLRPQRISTIKGNTAAAQVFKQGNGQPLVTLPGDEHRLHFWLPEGYGNLDFFLDSHGYYIEWMRKDWQNEENLARFFELVALPKQALQRLAPQFKRIEADFEKLFWNSRYVADR